MTTTERDNPHGGYEAEGGMNPMTKHEELERLARAATPGPWMCERHEPECVRTADGGIITPEVWTKNADAAFIAAANPATVLALLSANREMRAALEELLTACEADFGVPDENDADDEAVGASIDAETAVKFGHLRKARSALTTQRGDGE